jgi:hypothetical protein
MIQEPLLKTAVAGIPQRSEKQSDIQKLVGAFVHGLALEVLEWFSGAVAKLKTPRFYKTSSGCSILPRASNFAR